MTKPTNTKLNEANAREKKKAHGEKPGKQSLYDKIKTVVEANQIAITKNIVGKECYWTLNNNKIIGYDPSNENFSYGAYNKSLIGFLEGGGEKFIGIYERPLRRPKIGQRVQTLQKIRDCVGFDSGKDDPIYLAMKVKRLEFLYCVLWDGKNEFEVPYDCIAPWVAID